MENRQSLTCEEQNRLDRVLEILLEADLKVFMRLISEENERRYTAGKN